jgi:S1 RNA binding domain protein
MQPEIGKIYDGKVKEITSYGAFVEVMTEDGKPVTGMVHISEVANTYVNDIHDFLTIGQTVTVKMLQVNEQGKLSMSIKKALPQEEKPRQRTPRPPRRQERDKGVVWEPKPRKQVSEMSFEDMMSHFKQNSEERMCDIKRNTDRKSGSRAKPRRK